MITSSLVSILSCCIAGVKEPPSNEQLISIMSENTESVLVIRHDRIEDASEGLKEFSQIWKSLAQEDWSGEEDPSLHTVVMHAAAASSPRVEIWGGSRFRRPVDLGLGDYEGRYLWIVADSLTPLRERITADVDIEGDIEVIEHEGLEIFVGESRIVEYGNIDRIESTFVSMPDDNTLLMTESIEEIKHMLAAIKADDPSMPEQWAEVAQRTDLEVPILVLRSYDPTDKASPYSPLNPHWGDKRVEIKSYSWAVQKSKDLTVRLVCDTPNPTKALAFLREAVVVPRLADAWRPAGGKVGLVGDFTISIDDEEDLSYFTIYVMVAFGFVIAI